MSEVGEEEACAWCACAVGLRLESMLQGSRLCNSSSSLWTLV